MAKLHPGWPYLALVGLRWPVLAPDCYGDRMIETPFQATGPSPYLGPTKGPRSLLGSSLFSKNGHNENLSENPRIATPLTNFTIAPKPTSCLATNLTAPTCHRLPKQLRNYVPLLIGSSYCSYRCTRTTIHRCNSKSGIRPSCVVAAHVQISSSSDSDTIATTGQMMAQYACYCI